MKIVHITTHDHALCGIEDVTEKHAWVGMVYLAYSRELPQMFGESELCANCNIAMIDLIWRGFCELFYPPTANAPDYQKVLDACGFKEADLSNPSAPPPLQLVRYGAYWRKGKFIIGVIPDDIP